MNVPATLEVHLTPTGDAAGTTVLSVVGALPHSLLVGPPAGAAALAPSDWARAVIVGGENQIDLGGVRYLPHVDAPHRRASDPPRPPGAGRLVPLGSVIDFRGLLDKGLVVPLAQRALQLPLILRRKDAVTPRFREYTSDVGYDLQVFRSMLDEVDRNLVADRVAEPRDVAELVRGAALDSQWQAFCALFDRRLVELADLVGGFDKHEHEVHGFYFRKHMWDLILSSQFLARTNLKPRGYAGDSEMMRMVYEDRFVGPTVFARFMHRHPLRSAAAQAVRNRRSLLAGMIRGRIDAQAPKGERQAVRVLSVACGPARELGDIVADAGVSSRVRFTLLDQDESALAEATAEVEAVKGRTGATLDVRYVRESVRTMLRIHDLRGLWGSFDFVYSMGLFDYLTAPVARAVLARLYQLLDDGGELIVGNFHISNQTRVYMDYWMDWVLFYRTEREMLELAADLPGAKASVMFEETGSQLFLRVEKRSTG